MVAGTVGTYFQVPAKYSRDFFNHKHN